MKVRLGKDFGFEIVNVNHNWKATELRNGRYQDGWYFFKVLGNGNIEIYNPILKYYWGCLSHPQNPKLLFSGCYIGQLEFTVRKLVPTAKVMTWVRIQG